MTTLFVKGYSLIFLTLFVSFILLFIGCSGQNVKNSLSSTQPKSEYTDEDVIPKIAPHAVANINDSLKIVKSRASKLIKFDAQNSYDPDGDDKALSYRWINEDSQTISTEKSFVHKYDKKGLYETTLIVTDAQNLTAVDRVCVVVDMDKSDIPLIVEIQANQVVNANEIVNLTSRTACRDDIVKYEWRDGENLLSTKANFTKKFDAGKHKLVLTVEDFRGDRASDSVVVLTL